MKGGSAYSHGYTAYPHREGGTFSISPHRYVDIRYPSGKEKGGKQFVICLLQAEDI